MKCVAKTNAPAVWEVASADGEDTNGCCPTNWLFNHRRQVDFTRRHSGVTLAFLTEIALPLADSTKNAKPYLVTILGGKDKGDLRLGTALETTSEPRFALNLTLDLKTCNETEAGGQGATCQAKKF